MREKWRAREIDALGKKYRYKDAKKEKGKKKKNTRRNEQERERM